MFHGLTYYDCLRLAHVLARRPGPDKHDDPVVASQVCLDPSGTDDTPILCAYYAVGGSDDEHHILSRVRAMGRAVPRADRRVPDEYVQGTSPNSIGEGIQTC